MQLAATYTLTALFAGIAGIAIWPAGPDPAVVAVARATAAFVQKLPAALQAKACRGFDDAERRQWNYLPGRYAGVELGELDAEATGAAHGLLHALLSLRGYQKATAIFALEGVLKELEGKDGRDTSHRDPSRYALLVCGQPEPEADFTVRLQGHHVSVQCTFRGGRLAGCTPQFLGSNPHERRDGKAHGQRVLGREEDLARGLLALCSDAQRQRLHIAEAAPPDIFLGPAAKPEALGPRAGLPATAMSSGQQELLWQLCSEYAGNLRAEFAEEELRRIRAQWDTVHFAWAGDFERGQGHYFRIHGDHFAIEYDNTQNDANHVHTVWRDFDRDGGGETLRAHHEAEPHGAGK